MRRWMGLVIGAAAAFGAGAAQAQLGIPPIGQAHYRNHCASCHDNPDATRSPSLANLQAMSGQTLTYALTAGKMKTQGAAMDEQARRELIDWLTGGKRDTAETWSQAMMCDAKRAPVVLTGAPTVATYGFDARNSRVLTAKQAGLGKAALGRLAPAWAIAFPNVTMMRSQAAVAGDNVFLPVAEAAAVYAFDVSDPARPCVQWVYRNPTGAPLRTSAAFGVIADGRAVLAVGGLDSTLHVLDAKTGKALWTKSLAGYSFSVITATPRVLKDRIVVAVSQFEIAQAADNRVKCCTNHGFLVSLDPATGRQQWRYDTMEDAKPLRDRGDGQMLYGPSGAPIWNSPVVDERRGLIYFGTGESNSPPAHRNTDALIAVRLADGKEAWSHQATANDIYNIGCGPKPPPNLLNCVSDTVYRDVDFGASLILGRLKDGRDLVFAGQKSGTVWALEPDTGEVVWRRDIGTGAANGGIHWGIAFDGVTIYVPVAVVGRPLPGGPPIDPSYKPGMYAVDAASGTIKWRYSVEPDCANGRDKRAPSCARHYGFSGAPTVIDGAVIQGGLDGRLYVLDAKTGRELWKTDTLGDYAGMNGVAGKGGSIDSASIVGVNGLLLVNSGYGMFGQAPGNVMLAFKPKN